MGRDPCSMEEHEFCMQVQRPASPVKSLLLCQITWCHYDNFNWAGLTDRGESKPTWLHLGLPNGKLSCTANPSRAHFQLSLVPHLMSHVEWPGSHIQTPARPNLAHESGLPHTCQKPPCPRRRRESQLTTYSLCQITAHSLKVEVSSWTKGSSLGITVSCCLQKADGEEIFKLLPKR